ncbi:BrnT family toxin [Rhizobium sp. P40RR-XXII]|uniref:BrnT family toxin n=1 Tax=Rhizobium sp. P40RR-XXII TaxID=2726739 RepID=UPI0014573C72|nr:BrnT family toxin [Rhizobium sp. P40RR-XXII]NLS20317.1 BrnT family toxin [Rhizobium sp. P40RR-XXII]
MNTRFEWDPVKAAGNVRKHGVSFETAIRVFADPFALSHHDRIEGGEYRWQTLGMVEGHVLLLVAHTIHEDDEDGHAVEVIRIISARKAEKSERRRYEQETR